MKLKTQQWLDGVIMMLGTAVGVAFSVFLPPMAVVMRGGQFQMPVAWQWVLVCSFAIAFWITFSHDRDAPVMTGELKRRAIEGKLRNQRGRLSRNLHIGFSWQALIGGVVGAGSGGRVRVGVGGEGIAALLGIG